MTVWISLVDDDPPHCPACSQELVEVDVDVAVHFGTETISHYYGKSRYQWARGMGSYVVSPGLLRWVTEGWGDLLATCPSCQARIDLSPNPDIFGGSHAICPTDRLRSSSHD